MGTTGTANHDAVGAADHAPAVGDQKMETDYDVAEAERAQSVEFDKSAMQNYDKMDKELAKYVSDGRIEISEEENNRLRRMIDKRILVMMIATYFLQAIDKGTMSFASIMGIIEDTGMHGQQVRAHSPSPSRIIPSYLPT